MSLRQSLRLTHRAWRYRLGSNRAEVAFVRRSLSRGDLAVDLGAHKGAFLYWLRASVGAQGCVHGFEPQPTLADRLTSIARVRRWSNLHVHQLAVAREAGTLRLGVPGGGTSPGARLLDPSAPDASFGDVHEVKVVTLDEHFADRKSPVKFIKCDVEGAELAAFQGGEQLLRTDLPNLLFECEQRHLQQHTMSDVFDWLQQLGYEGQFFQGGRLWPLEAFSADEHQRLDRPGGFNHPDYCNNFAFIAPSRPGAS
ncbi:MAG: FkbM family methyltransferase [Phycisphaerales bacterium]|nr:FkbM family methyltransferase [Phycisphaerales bacterium]